MTKRRAVKRREVTFGVVYWAWRLSTLAKFKGRAFPCFIAFYMGCDGRQWTAAFNGLQLGPDPNTKFQAAAYNICGFGATPQIALQEAIRSLELVERLDYAPPPSARYSVLEGLR